MTTYRSKIDAAIAGREAGTGTNAYKSQDLADDLDLDLIINSETTSIVEFTEALGTVSAVTGAIGSSSTFSYTEIDVSTLDAVTFKTFAFTASNYGYAFLNEIDENLLSVKTTTVDTITVEKPAGATKFRICWYAVTVEQNITGITYTQERLKSVVEKINKNIFFNKEILTIGDSLCTGGIWQNKLSQLTGCLFDNTKNIGVNPTSAGGTQTISTVESGGLWRTRNAAQKTYDIAIIENVNDVGYPNLGQITDPPFMLSQILFYPTVYSSKLEAQQAWTNDFATIVQSFAGQELDKSAINLRYNDSGYNVKINNIATTDGTFNLQIGSIVYGITVTTDDTILDIVNKILEYSFQFYTDTIGDDNESVDFAGLTTPPIFTANGTGVSATITATITAENFMGYVFLGNHTTEWTTPTNWGVASVMVSLYAGYKGLIEYLKLQNPSKDIFWLIPSYYSLDDTTYVRADGTFDIEAYKESNIYSKYQSLRQIIIDVCNYYSIRYLDVDLNCGISPVNYKSYYNVLNVHPKTEGYYKWAETIYALI